MLLSLVLELSPLNEAGMHFTSGSALRALFLDLVGVRDPIMAADLHRQSKEKPYTVSPVFGNFARDGQRLRVNQGDRCWLRFTSISPELSALLIDMKGELNGRELALLEQKFLVTAVHHDASQHPWAGKSDYRALYNSRVTSQVPLSPRAGLLFASPTTFRSGRLNMPLPLPRLFFSQLSYKWNQYSPVHLGNDIAEFLQERVTLSYCDIRTSMLNFGKYSEIGFTGKCEFMLPSSSGDIWDRVFHVLCDFAFYAGVGAKCTAGLGQVQRVDVFKPVKGNTSGCLR